MGSVYPRGEVLWMAWVDEHGKRRQKSTAEAVPPNGIRLGATPQEREAAVRQAEALLAEIERQVEEAKRGTPAPVTLPIQRAQTLAAAAEIWVASRRGRVAAIRKEEQHLRDYLLPVLGDMKPQEVRPAHVRALFAALSAKGSPGPKTILNVYSTCRSLFKHLAKAEVIAATPCNLSIKDRELPERSESSPGWNDRAVFEREEALRLRSDPKIPADRRVRYSLLFLTGMRIGEGLARRFRDWHPERLPLGSLDVFSQWHTEAQAETELKTKVARIVPVHPDLARVLTWWRDVGYRETTGRDPKPEDYLIPPAFGRARPMRSQGAWKQLQRDCAALGIRPRRTHDSRRSFVTWAREDGAPDFLLKRVTHGAKRSEILDVYSSPAWARVCASVNALRSDSGSFPVLSTENTKAVRSPEGLSAVDDLPGIPDSLLHPSYSQNPSSESLAVSATSSANQSESRGARTPVADMGLPLDVPPPEEAKPGKPASVNRRAGIRPATVAVAATVQLCRWKCGRTAPQPTAAELGRRLLEAIGDAEDCGRRHTAERGGPVRDGMLAQLGWLEGAASVLALEALGYCPICASSIRAQVLELRALATEAA